MGHTHWKQYHPSPLIRVVQIFLLALIIVGIGLLLTQNMWVPKVVTYILGETSEMNTIADYKSAAFTMPDGTTVSLVNGFAERVIESDAASTVTTRYFGNELVADITGDGADDVVFFGYSKYGWKWYLFLCCSSTKNRTRLPRFRRFFLGG